VSIYRFITSVCLAFTLSCGGGGSRTVIGDADGTAGGDDAWPGDLYKGEVDLFNDGGPDDLDAQRPEDVPIAYDTDYIPGDGVVVFQPDTDPDQYVDGVCVPDCQLDDGGDAECGGDGCGSLCGVCGFGLECKGGLCEVECLADCAGRECGPDPECFESCGECDDGFECNPAGNCIPICDPEINCADYECGPDGCGGSCGTCPANEICTDDQVCEPHPCGDVEPGVGTCQGQDILVQCVDDALVEVDCKGFGDDFWCGFDAQEGVYECKQGCVPTCEFPNGDPIECGYDGCYGTCGDCPGGWDCVSGLCNPNQGADCGWVPDTGACYDNVLWFCDEGILYFQDCGAQGLTCKYNMSLYAFECSP